MAPRAILAVALWVLGGVMPSVAFMPSGPLALSVVTKPDIDTAAFSEQVQIVGTVVGDALPQLPSVVAETVKQQKEEVKATMAAQRADLSQKVASAGEIVKGKATSSVTGYVDEVKGYWTVGRGSEILKEFDELQSKVKTTEAPDPTAVIQDQVSSLAGVVSEAPDAIKSTLESTTTEYFTSGKGREIVDQVEGIGKSITVEAPETIKGWWSEGRGKEIREQVAGSIAPETIQKKVVEAASQAGEVVETIQAPIVKQVELASKAPPAKKFVKKEAPKVENKWASRLQKNLDSFKTVTDENAPIVAENVGKTAVEAAAVIKSAAQNQAESTGLTPTAVGESLRSTVGSLSDSVGTSLK